MWVTVTPQVLRLRFSSTACGASASLRIAAMPYGLCHICAVCSSSITTSVGGARAIPAMSEVPQHTAVAVFVKRGVRGRGLGQFQEPDII